MTTVDEKTKRFRALHEKGAAFIIPNPWDAGSARILEGLGFQALATTSSGFALTKGWRDYGVTREEVISHCREIAGAIDIPITADLENGFGAKPEDVGETIRLAGETPLCGGSIEDSTGDADKPVFDQALAVERIAAGAEAVRGLPRDFVLTARAEAFLYGKGDLDEVIARLNAFADAGADVVYAPGLPDMDAVAAVCGALSKPVNILIIGDLTRHRVAEFARAGAARLSVGGSLAWSAYGTLSDAQAMLKDGAFDVIGGKSEGAKIVSQYLKD